MCGIRSLSEKIIYFTTTLSLYKIESVEVKIYEKKEPVLDYLIHMGNGYLLTAEALSHGISRPTIAEYVKKNHLEKLAKGIYFSPDAWPDDLYFLYLQNRRIIFSHETALFLHGLMEREPVRTYVTVRTGYNATHLREKGIRVHQAKPESYELGASSILTGYGNKVPVYDKERTICDLIKGKEKTDIQIFQTAMKEYMDSKDKNIPNLMLYASKLKMEDKVRLYTEVML